MKPKHPGRNSEKVSNVVRRILVARVVTCPPSLPPFLSFQFSPIAATLAGQVQVSALHFMWRARYVSLSSSPRPLSNALRLCLSAPHTYTYAQGTLLTIAFLHIIRSQTPTWRPRIPGCILTSFLAILNFEEFRTPTSFTALHTPSSTTSNIRLVDDRSYYRWGNSQRPSFILSTYLPFCE